MPKNTIVAIEATVYPAPDLTENYQLIATLPHSVSILRIVNASDESIYISYDSTNPYDCIITEDTLQIPAQTNSQPQAKVANFSAGTKIYAALVTGDSGATGVIVVTGYYQPQGI
jgi:hypothetical protein